jgi:hypothetical protein
MSIRAGDIDIDLADRSQILEQIEHVPASIKKDDGTWIKHNTGVYVSAVPKNPVIGAASIDYIQAEARGYVKIDFINNSVYQLVRDRVHLAELANKTPDWQLLNDSEFFQQIVHIGNHYDLYRRLTEPVSSLEHMAMFLALIRPAKRALVGRPWSWIEKTIWEKSEDGSYGFKRSHSYSYALLVAVHINLLCERGHKSM